MNQLLNRFLFFLASVLSFVDSTASYSPVRTIYQYPLGIWVENIAVRPNGNLLVSTISLPDVYLLDPLRPNISVAAHTFSSASGTLGIAEISHDAFAVITGNFSLTTGEIAPGSFSVWSVDMTGVEISTKGELCGSPNVSKIADIPEGLLLNGITALPKSNGLALITDYFGGVIYRLDTRTAAYEVAINNTFTNVVAGTASTTAGGVNGVKARGGEVYFTNTGKGLFARMPIHPDGTPAGNASIVTRPINATENFDDFALSPNGSAFLVTGSGNSVEEVTRDGRARIIAGSLNSTLIAQPTAAAFGRGPTDKNVLYVVTAGGLGVPINPGNRIVGGQVLAVSLDV